MKVFNYIRVSTKEQNEQRQIVAMNEFNQANGYDNTLMMIDKCSGTNSDRPQLQALIKALESDHKIEKGNNIKIPRLVVIKSIDRLSRNYDECRKLWQQITDTGADIVVLDMPLLDTRQHKDLLGNFVSDLILQVLAYVGQQENDFRRQRQAEGIAVAKAQGKHLGRPRAELPSNFQDEYEKWKQGQQTATVTWNNLGLTKTTFYKLVKQYEQSKATQSSDNNDTKDTLKANTKLHKITQQAKELGLTIGLYDESIENMSLKQLDEVLDQLRFGTGDVKVSIKRRQYVVEVVIDNSELDLYLLTRDEYESKYGYDLYDQEH